MFEAPEKIQSHLDFLIVIDDFLSRAECEAFVQLCNHKPFVEKQINGTFEGSNEHFLRNGLKFSSFALENFTLANALWKRIEKHAPKEIDDYVAVGLNERLRFYRYEVGQHFGAHTDGYFERPNGERSFLTLMIYLNDDFTGGETLFLKREKIIAPKRGTALLFTHHQWHAGLAVKEGYKYILRTDAMFKSVPPASRVAGQRVNGL
jgi:hypothetical protein